MKYTLSQRGVFITPHGAVRGDRDGLYHLSDAQREYIAREFGVIATPAHAPPARTPTPEDTIGAALAAQVIQENREAANAHAADVNRIPVPKPSRRKR